MKSQSLRREGNRSTAERTTAARVVPETPLEDELAVGMLIGRARSTLLTNLDAELEH
jgi:hypothetical protein